MIKKVASKGRLSEDIFVQRIQEKRQFCSCAFMSVVRPPVEALNLALLQNYNVSFHAPGRFAHYLRRDGRIRKGWPDSSIPMGVRFFGVSLKYKVLLHGHPLVSWGS